MEMFPCTHHIPEAGFVSSFPYLKTWEWRKGCSLFREQEQDGNSQEKHSQLLHPMPHPFLAPSRSFPWKTSGFLG